MIDRRAFLQAAMLGAGAVVLGPRAQSLAAAAAAIGPGAGFPKRFVFIRKSNGQRPHELVLPSLPQDLMAKEKNKEAFDVAIGKHALPEWMAELDGDREHLTILQGLSSKMSENGHFSHQSVMGCFKSGGGSVSRLKRATIDYELAKLYPSPIGHVELSFAGSRSGIVPGFSVPAPYKRNFCYADSITAYQNLFKSVLNPSLVRSDNQMLEYLRDVEGKGVAELAGDDVLSFMNHIDSIDATIARNTKLLEMSDAIAKHMPDFASISELGDSGASTPDKEEAMTEVLVAALLGGMVNVVTYTIDDLTTTITGLPGHEKSVINIHGLGHSSSESATSARLAMQASHIRQAKTIMDRLKEQPEGDGTMFDNTMIMYFPEGGETHHGSGVEAPFVILSGKNCNLDIAGRYIRLPFWRTKGHMTLGNWYTTLLNAHGNPIKHYGDLDSGMAVKRLPQEGPIEYLMRESVRQAAKS
jgi:hypothetical protein